MLPKNLTGAVWGGKWDEGGERERHQETGGEGGVGRRDRASVPARLGKGQGAKEIGHNLACEQPKFGHNLVRK